MVSPPHFLLVAVPTHPHTQICFRGLVKPTEQIFTNWAAARWGKLLSSCKVEALFIRDACGSQNSWSQNQIWVWWCTQVWFFFFFESRSNVLRHYLGPDKVLISLMSARGEQPPHHRPSTRLWSLMSGGRGHFCPSPPLWRLVQAGIPFL